MVGVRYSVTQLCHLEMCESSYVIKGFDLQCEVLTHVFQMGRGDGRRRDELIDPLKANHQMPSLED